MNPPLAEIKHGIEVLRQKAESDFEIEVGERIIKRGYRVIPQLKPLPNDFSYRIDLVVQGEKNRVAVECDGDRYHELHQWERDQQREAQLRRAGWKFWRISGSAFYRNKEKSLEGLWEFLESEGIKPGKFGNVAPENNEETVSTSAQDETKRGTFGRFESIDQRGKDRKDDKNLEINRDKELGKEGPSFRPSKEGTFDSSIGTTEKPQPIDLVKMSNKLPVSSNWKIWDDLVKWGTRTGCIESRSRGIGYQIIEKLKLGRKLNPWLKNEMERIWKIAMDKGFKLET